MVNYWGSDQASKDDLSSSVEAIKNKSENFNYIDKTSDFPVPGGPCTTRASWCFILSSISFCS
jgi:hypothetical protein